MKVKTTANFVARNCVLSLCGLPMFAENRRLGAIDRPRNRENWSRNALRKLLLAPRCRSVVGSDKRSLRVARCLKPEVLPSLAFQATNCV